MVFLMWGAHMPKAQKIASVFHQLSLFTARQRGAVARLESLGPYIIES